MKPVPFVVLILAGFIPASTASAQEAIEPATRPTVTIATFDTDRTGWMPPPNLGETLAELLTDRLVTAGSFRLVDRDWLVPAGEDRRRVSFAVLLDRAAAAGVDYLIAGSLTRLSIEKHTTTGGGVLPVPFVGGLIKKKKTESAIGLTIRVIDVRTGEVIATSTGESGASMKTTSGGGLAVVGHVPLPLALGKGTSVTGFHDRLVDTAVQEAITMAAEKLVAAAPRLRRAEN